MHLNSFIWLSCLFLIGCATSQPAPVIDRAPVEKKTALAKPSAKAASAEANGEKDWRPDFHTVKKGETLYGISLQYGFDYKEIAQANNLAPPYTIHVGQQLRLLKVKESPPTAATADGGVVITPLKTDSVPAVTVATAPQALPPGEPPLLKEPKALREPYSELAMATPAAKPKPEKPADSNKTAETEKPETAQPAETISKTDTSRPESTAAADDESIDWAWPANGKVIAGFSESSNAKGIDIGGTQGQPVNAAAPGKVIYSGSDLRGYGKLVIIKHNKTYLSVYAHNSSILVKEGQQVSKGQKIAEMGNSDADRVKLHFEIRRQGKSVDPAKYLSNN